jgi:tripartite-type tricarboxylate transporter receptor subunit TctC
MKRLFKVAIACAVGVISASGAHAQDMFYKGKNITVIIGAKGGSLLVGAQIIARYMSKHLPGEPSVTVTPMLGGAHIGATGFVYSAAPADGLTLLAASPNVALAQLAKIEQVRFDMRKFEWLGSSGPDGAMFSIRADLPYKTVQELKASGQEIIVGTTGPGSNAHDMPLLLKEFGGLKLKLIPGYSTNSEILLAVQRKEVDGWAALGSTIKSGVDTGAVRALVRARAPVPGFNDLPVDETLTNDPIGKALMGIRGIPLQIGRAWAVRAGTPPERIAMLREAFAKAVADPQAKADGVKASIDMEYISGKDVAKDFDELFNQPPEVLEVLGKYLKPE